MVHQYQGPRLAQPNFQGNRNNPNHRRIPICPRCNLTGHNATKCHTFDTPHPRSNSTDSIIITPSSTATISRATNARTVNNNLVFDILRSDNTRDTCSTFFLNSIYYPELVANMTPSKLYELDNFIRKGGKVPASFRIAHSAALFHYRSVQALTYADDIFFRGDHIRCVKAVFGEHATPLVDLLETVNTTPFFQVPMSTSLVLRAQF